jgi:hypothetical protein
VGHYIDGLNLVLEEPPQIAKTLIIPRSGQADAGFRGFEEKGWMQLVPANKDDLSLGKHPGSFSDDSGLFL